MSILYICATNPHKANFGGEQRTYRLFRELWHIGNIRVDDHLMEILETSVLKNLNFFSAWRLRILQRILLYFVERNVSGGWIANEEQVRSVHFKNPVVPLKNIPIGPSVSYQAHEVIRDIIFTVGLMGYSPNYKGVNVFLQSIWPNVHKRFPKLKYYIIGKDLPIEYREHWSNIPNVFVCGFVEDLESIYKRAYTAVVPVDSGGGTCIKVLEALAYSRTCFATRFGARGLRDEDLKDGKIGVFCYENAQDFVTILEKLIGDSKFRSERECAGAKFIQREYSKESFSCAVHKVLDSVSCI